MFYLIALDGSRVYAVQFTISLSLFQLNHVPTENDTMEQSYEVAAFKVYLQSYFRFHFPNCNPISFYHLMTDNFRLPFREMHGSFGSPDVQSLQTSVFLLQNHPRDVRRILRPV